MSNIECTVYTRVERRLWRGSQTLFRQGSTVTQAPSILKNFTVQIYGAASVFLTGWCSNIPYEPETIFSPFLDFLKYKRQTNWEGEHIIGASKDKWKNFHQDAINFMFHTNLSTMITFSGMYKNMHK